MQSAVLREGVCQNKVCIGHLIGPESQEESTLLDGYTLLSETNDLRTYKN